MEAAHFKRLLPPDRPAFPDARMRIKMQHNHLRTAAAAAFAALPHLLLQALSRGRASFFIQID
jgi:hypothetical protein